MSVNKSTHRISLHMEHLLLYVLPLASRTGSLSLVQLSFPFFILSRNSAHWSWKERTGFLYHMVYCIVIKFLNNLSKECSCQASLTWNIRSRITIYRKKWAGTTHMLWCSVVMPNFAAFNVPHREMTKLVKFNSIDQGWANT